MTGAQRALGGAEQSWIAGKVRKTLAQVDGAMLGGQRGHDAENGGAHGGQAAGEGRCGRGCGHGAEVLQQKGVGRGLQFVVVDVAGHGAGNQVTAEAVAEQLGKAVHKVAQVGAALEGHARHALAKQVAYGAHL